MDPLNSSSPVAVLDDVTVVYGRHAALSHVTAHVSRGATGLLGPNGAGKSTLILALLGLVRPCSGRIDVLGRSVATAPLDVRSRIGYMPEHDAWIPELTAISSVAYCGELAGLPRGDALERAHDVLSYVHLDDVRYRRVETLSTGMRQRLKLAQALVHDPELLILDEPTNGLDPKGRDQMLALISDLATRVDLNVILSSHLLPDVERVCDAVVVLNHGSVVAAGGLHDLTRTESGTFEVRIKGNVVAFQHALSAQGLSCEVGDGDIIRVAVGCDEPRTIFAVANRMGVQVRHLRRQVQTLDALFERLMADRPTANAQAARTPSSAIVSNGSLRSSSSPDEKQ